MTTQQLPAAYGSINATFVAFQIRDPTTGNVIEAYQHISTMPVNQSQSPEELRLSYMNSSTFATAKWPSKRPFGTAFPGKTQCLSTATTSSIVTVSLPKHTNLNPFAPFNGRAAASSGPPVAMGSEIVYVDVGRDPVKRFTVYKDPITAGSEFVQRALGKDWKEASECVVPLPDDEPEVFSTYQSWLYWRRIFVGISSIADWDTKDPGYSHLIKCYVLGEKILDSAFKDAVIDAIIDLLRKTQIFHLGLANTIYNSTPARSPLRMLWRDVYTCAGNSTWLEEKFHKDPLHVEFMMDMATKSMSFWRENFRDEPQSRRAAFFPGQSTCAYHEHVSGECYASKPF